MTFSPLQRTHPGAAIYNAFVLRVYDAWVLGFSNRWVWRCPTRATLLPFYRKHLGRRHLEVGAGSGYYLQHAGLTADTALTILDMNESSLRAAARRAPVSADCVLADALAVGDQLGGRVFDSIAMFYLLHCLPGNMAGKAAAFSGLAKYLSEDGVLYGATILGETAGHNVIGRMLMRLYNRKGIFGNYDDTADELARALVLHFREAHVVRCGTVALFTARKPLRHPG